MRIVLYTHSLVSDWNHGNAHFLRGVMRELTHRGHRTVALEPEQGWSRANLLCDQGSAAIARFGTDFPDLTVETYDAVFDHRSEEHTSELQSLMSNSYAIFCLKK